MLRCSRCQEVKPEESFYVRRSRRRGYSSECKTCHKSVPRYRDAEARRDRTLRRRYGISASEYDALLKAQDGQCALCLQPPPSGERLHVDHDHDTGTVRGLLCFHCNTALGRIERATLPRVLAYLSRRLAP